MSEYPIRSSSNLLVAKGWLVLWGLTVATIALAAPKPTPAELRISSPCSESETWTVAPRLARTLPPEIRGFIKGLTAEPEAAIRAFADAFTFRQKAKSPADQLLGDYAIARSLNHAQVFGLAAELFDNIIQQPTSAAKAPIQIAAISCLGQIRRRYSAFAFSNAAMKRLPDFFKKGQPNKRELNILWYAVTEKFLMQIREYDKAPAKQRTKLAKGIEETLDRLKASPAHSALALGMWAAYRHKTRDAAAHLTKFVQAEGLTEALDAKRDSARLLLARSLYELGDFKGAVKHLELVDKRANELVQSLVYLASSQLMAADYPKAIGASLGLQSGSLKETFAPESLMVASMALNELCHFPESLAMVNKFKRQYQGTFFWLHERKKGGAKEKEPLYPMALAFLKGEKPKDLPKDELEDEAAEPPTPAGTVPVRVGSEWIRSPIFISKQESINHLFRTMRKLPKLMGLGRTVAKTEVRAIGQAKTELREKVQKARAALKPGEKLAATILEEANALRLREARQARLVYALPHFDRALTGYRSRASQWQGYLTNEIEKELRTLNTRMYSELTSVMENNELIEAEIWNGASQDIVWQNAHPEFKEMVKSGALRNDRSPTSAADVYDWGSAGQGLDGSEEVWEDEIGAIQANLQNDCANKEKYMKIQQGRR